jgi:WS/DGAT/MGAT family acyltransferase
VNALTVPGRSARLAARLVPGFGRVARLPRRSDAPFTSLAPGTRFSGPVSPHRVLDACFFELADVKRMRKAVPGATVNDVALSVLGGALRQYLVDAGELPASPLRAMTPVSVRAESERADLGNLVSAMVVSLATDVEDPVERLAAVNASTTSSKEVTEAIGARNLTELSQFAPGALLGLGSRLAGQFARRNTAGVINTVVTNVPGAREPLYLCGAELLRWFGAGPVVNGMGLINIVGSYVDQFMLSFTADRAMMPDFAHYAGCIYGSFNALSKATT